MDLQEWFINMSPTLGFIVALIFIWNIVWKGIALWKAAKNNDKAWFVALLVINTLGILEIFYVYVFSKRDNA